MNFSCTTTTTSPRNASRVDRGMRANECSFSGTMNPSNVPSTISHVSRSSMTIRNAGRATTTNRNDSWEFNKRETYPPVVNSPNQPCIQPRQYIYQHQHQSSSTTRIPFLVPGGAGGTTSCTLSASAIHHENNTLKQTGHLHGKVIPPLASPSPPGLSLYQNFDENAFHYHHNFHSHHDSPPTTRSISQGHGAPVANIDGCWECETCLNVNYPRRCVCYMCGVSRSTRNDQLVNYYVANILHSLKAKKHLTTPITSVGMSTTNSIIAAKSNTGSVGNAVITPIPTNTYKPHTMIVNQPSIIYSNNNNNNNNNAPGMKAEMINMKFKTKLCRQFLEFRCLRGDECDFAHGSSELRQVSDNAAGTGAAINDHLKLRFDLTAVVNAIIEPSNYTSHSARVECVTVAMNYNNNSYHNRTTIVKVGLYGKWVMEFRIDAVRLLEAGASSAMSLAGRNCVLEMVGASIRCAGIPSRWRVLDLQHQTEVEPAFHHSWHSLQRKLSWKDDSCNNNNNINNEIMVPPPTTSRINTTTSICYNNNDNIYNYNPSSLSSAMPSQSYHHHQHYL